MKTCGDCGFPFESGEKVVAKFDVLVGQESKGKPEYFHRPCWMSTRGSAYAKGEGPQLKTVQEWEKIFREHYGVGGHA